MSHENFERFSKEILAKDEGLRMALGEAGDFDAFSKLAAQAGEQRGYSFTPDEVRSVLEALPDLEASGKDVVGGRMEKMSMSQMWRMKRMWLTYRAGMMEDPISMWQKARTARG